MIRDLMFSVHALVKIARVLVDLHDLSESIVQKRATFAVSIHSTYRHIFGISKCFYKLFVAVWYFLIFIFFFIFKFTCEINQCECIVMFLELGSSIKKSPICFWFCMRSTDVPFKRSMLKSRRRERIISISSR